MRDEAHREGREEEVEQAGLDERTRMKLRGAPRTRMERTRSRTRSTRSEK